MSFGQQRLWFLHQLDPDRATYVSARLYRITGPLDTDALGASFDEIVRRHEALRTSFHLIDGQPTQRVEPHTRFDVPAIMLDHLPAEHRQDALWRLYRQQGRMPFDLARGPLLRAVVVRLSADEHALVVSRHHIASDAWSQGIFHRELGAHYEALAEGRPSPLPPLSIQYADYARWQRRQLQPEAIGRHLAYWTAQLAGAPDHLDIPPDRPRPARPTYDSAHESRVLPLEVVARLRHVAAAHRATLFMVVLGALQVLLHRYTGRDDIVVGAAVAGRLRADIEPLIGFFVNTLPLRTSLAGNPTFADVLGRVRRVALDGLDHQALPFERLVEELQPAREPGRTPLVDVVLTYQNVPAVPLRLAGAKVELLDVQGDPATFDLQFAVSESPNEATVNIGYQSELFDASTIRRLLLHFETLLRAVADTPDTPIARLPILTNTEREQIVVGWNDTGVDLPADATVHGLFEAQVARTPHAPAVAFEGTTLSYGELDARARRLAERLRHRGVGPDVPTGVYVERSAEMLVALLGILKAGGAYVPLDPSHPRDRVSFILDDSAVSIVVSQRSLRDTLARTLGLPPESVVCVDEDEGNVASEERCPTTPSGPRGHHLAYVLYTSGSTGRPKGVCITHRSVVNLLLDAQRRLALGTNDLVVSATTYTFDISVAELFLPLVSGAQVEVVSNEVAHDGHMLTDVLRARQPTLFQATPSMWQSLCAAGWRGHPDMTCLTIGEQLPLALAREVASRCGRLWNHYGPTETTVWSTAALVDASAERVSIGTPIANTQVYVLDAALSPVPPGVAGELYIGGAGLAREYLRRAELTHQRFVPSPFLPGERLYRTGDRARWLADGRLECLDRTDRQVKIRGHRVEPAEIERVLLDHRDIVTGAVDVRLHRDEPQLVAYFVPRDPAAPVSGDEVRQHLRTRLPDYMVPAAFVHIAEMPLTANGKVDRRRLPDPTVVPAADFVAPRTPVEETIAEVWAGVLGVERVGIHDDFFKSGGHSLLATQIVARLREQLHIPVSIRMLFDSPTVATLAARLSPAVGAGRGPAVEPTATGAPLSFAQERFWLLDQLDPGDPAYNIADAYTLKGPLRADALERAFVRLVDRHDVLRTTFIVVDDEPRQFVQRQTSFSLRVHDLRGQGSPGGAVARLLDEDARRPFDLTRDCLLRGSVLRTGDDEHVLLLTVHHIAADASSLRVLWRELGAFYNREVTGQGTLLAPLRARYTDFARWQREHLTEARLSRHLAYWRRQLQHLSPLELPADRQRPGRRAHHGLMSAAEVSADLVRRLKAQGHVANVTFFTVLLAAFQLLLARLTGRDDVVVGSPVANRQRQEFEDLVGVFLNTVVLRVKASGSPTFRDFLGRVRTAVLDALEHQDVPFEHLLQVLGPARDMSRSPLFQVSFNLTDQDDEPFGPRLHALQASDYPLPSTQAKYDLTVYLALDRGALRIRTVHDADVFDQAHIRELLDQYVLLLHRIADDIDRPLNDYDLVTRAAARCLPDPSAPLWHEMVYEPVPVQVLARAAERPDAIAIRWGKRECCYDELAQRASRIASALVARSVSPGDVVALEGLPGIGTVAAMVGILLAGGVVLPLAATLPAARKRRMMAQARATRLLGCGVAETDRAWRDEEASGLDCCDLDSLGTACSDFTAPTLPTTLPPLAGDAAAYIFFTSGSTGDPKGMRGPHRSISHFIEWQRATFGVTAEDRVAQLTSLSFDVILRDIFLPLTTGATLCIPEQPEEVYGPAVLRWFSDERITIVHVVPSVARRWLEGRDGAQCDWRPRCVFFAGEPLTSGLVRRWHATFPGSRVMNLYGPSETCMIKGWHEVGSEPPPGIQPITHPLPATQLLVLNPSGRPCGIGEPGEIVIRTRFGTLGYLDAVPTADRARFRPNPFRDDGKDIVYHTGDVGRYRPDGGLDLLGRLDAQVKVRGVRIEPREVEIALDGHPGVSNSVVSVWQDDTGESELVAHVAGSATVDELRGHLLQRLPPFMIPDRFVVLEALPLTVNGKVDRQALPRPGRDRPALQVAYAAPRTPAERTAAAIFCEVLALDRVGIHDSFFDLGGHSLLATRVITRARAAFGADVSLRQLFESPTIAGLCKVLATGSEDPAE